MCGSNHDHDHGHCNDRPIEDDTITVEIGISGVVKITTGRMVTAHATVRDAVAALARALNVNLGEARRIIRGMREADAQRDAIAHGHGHHHGH